MSVTVTPTGRTRLRVHKTMFHPTVLVFQLEFKHEGFICDPSPMGGTIDINHTVWKDATVGDVTVWDPLDTRTM